MSRTKLRVWPSPSNRFTYSSVLRAEAAITVIVPALEWLLIWYDMMEQPQNKPQSISSHVLTGTRTHLRYYEDKFSLLYLFYRSRMMCHR